MLKIFSIFKKKKKDLSSLIYILYDYVIVKIFIIQIETSAAFVIKSWSFHWFLSNSCLRLVICLEQREMRGEESNKNGSV